MSTVGHRDRTPSEEAAHVRHSQHNAAYLVAVALPLRRQNHAVKYRLHLRHQTPDSWLSVQNVSS